MSSLYCYSVFSLDFCADMTASTFDRLTCSRRSSLKVFKFSFSRLNSCTLDRSVEFCEDSADIFSNIRHRSSVYLRHSFCCAWCTIFLSCRNSLHGAIAVHLYRGHAGCRIPKGCSPFCGVQGRRPCRGIQGGRAHLASLGRCGAASGAKVACHFAKLA